MEPNAADHAVIMRKLATVRRELHAVSNAIMALEASVRTNDERAIADHLQADPLKALTASVQDTHGAIARTFRISNTRVNANGLGGGSAAGASTIPVK